MTDFYPQPPPGDAFDRAAAAVRGPAVPPPPADLASSIINRLQLAEVRTRRRRWIVRGMSIGGLAACLAVAVTWGGGRADAAEGLRLALDNQQKAKSFRAIVRAVAANAPGTVLTEQKMYGQGVKVRIEAGDLTSVCDGDAGKLVLLDRKAKVARVADEPFIKGAGGHPEVATMVKKMLEKDGAEDLGEKFQDGRKVHVYRVKGLKTGEQTMDVTYTVETKRELPVRLEIAIAGGPLAMIQTIDYLGFDEELDPKLFDLTIPEGYKKEELKLPVPAKK